MTKRVENVQPLSTNEEINNMILALRRGNGAYPKRPEIAERDVLLFLIGINTGLRVNDIIRLKVKDVKKDTFLIREGKTRKQREINVSMLRNEIDSFIEDKADRKSTRLNSSHVAISYAVFCLKKKQRSKR